MNLTVYFVCDPTLGNQVLPAALLGAPPTVPGVGGDLVTRNLSALGICLYRLGPVRIGVKSKKTVSLGQGRNEKQPHWGGRTVWSLMGPSPPIQPLLAALVPSGNPGHSDTAGGVISGCPAPHGSVPRAPVRPPKVGAFLRRGLPCSQVPRLPGERGDRVRSTSSFPSESEADQGPGHGPERGLWGGSQCFGPHSGAR